MHYEAEVRQPALFLEELAKKLSLPLTDTGQSPASFYARHNQQPNNPQETYGAPPLATPQRIKLADLPRRD